MGKGSYPGLDEFLQEQPLISIKPSDESSLILEGEFQFTAEYPGLSRVTDSYTLSISVPAAFPKDLPVVTETGGRIPQDPNFHNGTGTLCLGSPMRLMAKLQAEPTLQKYSERCIIPYLYAMTKTLTTGEKFVFGELAHNTPGEIDDYKDILGLKSEEHVIQALNCIVQKKRIANKMDCPCGCGLRLGRCRYNQTIKHFREIFPKAWLEKHLERIIRMRKSSGASR